MHLLLHFVSLHFLYVVLPEAEAKLEKPGEENNCAAREEDVTQVS